LQADGGGPVPTTSVGIGNMSKTVSTLLEGPLYHVTNVENRDAILRDGLKAKDGSWHGVKWKRQVFFVTTRIGAYEMANNFIHETRGEYIFIPVDPAKMSGRLRPDKNYDQGVWAAADVPREAIIDVEPVNEEFFESAEFLNYMGVDEGDELT
jgi:hypothetical protein